MVGRGIVLLLAALALAPAPASAQLAERSRDVASTGPSAPMPVVRGGRGGQFERLSRGSQRIALAYYYAQDIEGGGNAAWPLDDIAAERLSGRSWTDIYAQMREAGALAGVSLREILSRSAAKWRGRPAAGSAPMPEPDAFEGLTAGSRRIAEALFDSQTIGPEGRQAWSLDQIATAKRRGASWSRILARMRADGLVEATDLDRIVAAAQRRERAFPTVVSARR